LLLIFLCSSMSEEPVPSVIASHTILNLAPIYVSNLYLISISISIPNNKGRKVSVVGSSNIFFELIYPSIKLHITLNATGK
jgi:hypothetical protein